MIYAKASRGYDDTPYVLGEQWSSYITNIYEETVATPKKRKKRKTAKKKVKKEVKQKNFLHKFNLDMGD